jgi:hypothetical protein
MKLMTYVCVWCAIVFGVMLIQDVWNRFRSGACARPQEPVIILKAGETIVAVADRPDGIRFYVEIDVGDGKSYE